LLTFSPTLFFLPLAFLGGYYFFSTVWVPRLLLTFKARHWVTAWSSSAVGVTSEVWPEIFLMFVQFGGLILVVWLLGVPTGTTTLTFVHPSVRNHFSFGTYRESVVAEWLHGRINFFKPRGTRLTWVVELVLTSSVSTAVHGFKTWPRLRPALVSGLTTSIHSR